MTTRRSGGSGQAPYNAAGFLPRRAALAAILDVTDPKPPRADSPLYTLPNVFPTPHIAGSIENDCRRMGRYAPEGCRRWLAGEPPRWQISRQLDARLA